MVIKVERDGRGRVWATAPCGCMLELPNAPADFLIWVDREMPEFMEHVLEGTPCDPRVSDIITENEGPCIGDSCPDSEAHAEGAHDV